MKAEVIFTGTELLLGQITNTNAPTLLRQLANLGIDVYREITVGDNQSRLVAAIRQAGERSDLILVGGGLGPTDDDIAREALAEALNLPLVADAQALETVKAFFSKLNFSMPESNKKQALVPAGGLLIENPIGTAPGILLKHLGKIYFLLPGPPREFSLMVANHLVPLLQDLNRGQPTVINSRIMKVCGMGEATIGEILKDLMAGANPTLGTVAQLGEIHLRITAKAADEARSLALITEMEHEIHRRIGKYVYGTGEDTLESVIGKLLAARRYTLATAESCTGGLLAHRLTNIPGSSAYFMMGLVAYDNRIKTGVLEVPARLLETRGAVSEEVAAAMATGIRRLAQTDIGIGITGIAGPGGSTPEKPVGLVYIGLDYRGKLDVRRRQMWGERQEIKERSAQYALYMLLRTLKNNNNAGSATH